MKEAWHPDDTGWRDAMMAEAARRTRAYRKPQPIADAVRQALAERGIVFWELSATQRDSDGNHHSVLKADGDDFGTHFISRTVDTSFGIRQPASPADAAAALRQIADALDPEEADDEEK
jgi:hypothetical protein